MNITSIYYTFHNRKVILRVYNIVKETENCFFTKNGRYFKSEIGEPVLKSRTAYPYIELVMVDADLETLKTTLSKWFTDEAHFVRNVKM